MKIAALLDDAGQAAVPQLGGALYVYQREGLNWVASRKLDFTPGRHGSMDELRRYLEQVRDWLEDCTVVAAGATTGYYRVLFGSLGIHLWGVRGTPEQFIEQIESFHLKAASAVAEPVEEAPAASIEPIPARTGHYRVDLREAMASKGSHTSRQVLIPFFSDASFQRLEIICDHVPRWFEAELEQFGLGSKVENQPGFARVHVYPLNPGVRASRQDAEHAPQVGCTKAAPASHCSSPHGSPVGG
jgi:Fe-only nitrogenase accessory protein AnfO